MSKRRHREAWNKRGREEERKRRHKDEGEPDREDRRWRRKAQTCFVLITSTEKAEKSGEFCSLDYRFGSNTVFTYQIKPLPQTVRSEL